MVSDIIREPALQWASWGDHDQILYWVLLADCLSSFKLSIKSFFADCYCFSNCLWSPFSRFVASDMRTCITVSLLRWSCLKGINCQPKLTRLFHRALFSTKSLIKCMAAQTNSTDGYHGIFKVWMDSDTEHWQHWKSESQSQSNRSGKNPASVMEVKIKIVCNMRILQM